MCNEIIFKEFVIWGKQSVKKYFEVDSEMYDYVDSLEDDLKLVVLFNQGKQTANWTLLERKENEIGYKEIGFANDDYEAVMELLELL